VFRSGRVESGSVTELETGEKVEVGPEPCQVRPVVFEWGHGGAVRRTRKVPFLLLDT